MPNIKDEDVILLAKESFSISEVIRKLGLVVSTTTYRKVKAIIKKISLDISHFHGYGWSKNKNILNSEQVWRKYSKEKIFSKNSPATRCRVKNLITKNKIYDYKCKECGISEWYGVQLSLHLDHINGVRNDNRLENLRFLCPNCHSLTSTYAGKNSTKKNKFTDEEFIEAAKLTLNIRQTLQKLGMSEGINYERVKRIMKKFNFSYPEVLGPPLPRKIKLNKYLVCEKDSYNKYCSYQCSRQGKQKANKPSPEDLARLIFEKPSIQLAKDFGVSDSTIKDWCLQYGIQKPPRGHWEKIYHGRVASS